jgi:hypothetical protein
MATPVPPIAKEREDMNACGLAKAEADARHRATAKGVFTKAGNEQVFDFIIVLVNNSGKSSTKKTSSRPD